MAAASAAFVVLAVLGATGRANPRLAAAAFGVAVVAAGASEIAGAVVADWPRVALNSPPGSRPVPAGRLSSLGSGLLLGSWGALLIGLDGVPLPARLAAVALLMVGLVLALVGQSQDRRRAEAARGSPATEQPAATDPARHFGSRTS
ncbi:MAG: hypothetical protein ACJ8FY_03090 [Gemmataceae bacterium]